MASYRTVFKPSVEKDLRSLPRAIVLRVLSRIEALADDPLPRQAVKLSGALHLYRLRVGDYRIVYGLDRDAEGIVIHHVRHRRDVYRRL